MVWRFGGGRENDQAQEGTGQQETQETRLTGKSLEIAQELVRASLEAERGLIERYS